MTNEIVKGGAGLVVQEYVPKDSTLEGLETQAREGKRGLWILRDPVPPWEYRRKKSAPDTEKECLRKRFAGKLQFKCNKEAQRARFMI